MDLGWPISHYTQIILTILIDEDSTYKNSSINSSDMLLNLMDSCNLPNKHTPQIKDLNDKIFHLKEDLKDGMVKF